MATGTLYYYYPDSAGSDTYGSAAICRLKITETWNDDTNTSNFTYELQVNSTYTGNFKVGGTLNIGNWTIVNGSVGTSSTSSDWSTIFYSAQNNVSHNADGTLSLTLKVTAGSELPGRFAIWWANNFNACFTSLTVGSKTYACHTNTIKPTPGPDPDPDPDPEPTPDPDPPAPTPQASTIASVSSAVNTTGTFAVNMTRKTAGTYHKLTIKYGSTVLYTSGAFETSHSYTIPRSFMEQNKTATSITCTASVQTYTNSACTTAVGSPATASFTVNADSGMVPSITSASVSTYNTGTSVSWSTACVKGYSKLSASITASTANCGGATISSYRMAFGSASVTSSSASFNSGSNVVTASGTLTVTLECTDQRGRKASTTRTISVTNYVNPYTSAVEAFRCNSGGTKAADGKYIGMKATANYTAFNGNTVTLTASVNGGSAQSLTSNTLKVVGGSYNPDTTDRVVFTITDRVGNSSSVTKDIATTLWAMQFMPQGNGVAFGKSSEKNNALQIPGTWDFYKGEAKLNHICVTANPNTDASVEGNRIAAVRNVANNLEAGQSCTAILQYAGNYYGIYFIVRYTEEACFVIEFSTQGGKMNYFNLS